MNILAVVETPSWIENHIVGSLTDLGHEVSIFPYGEAVGEFYGSARASLRSERNRQLVSEATQRARDGRLDLIFCYVYDDFLEARSARALSALGVPMVNLNVDMANQWYRQIGTARYFTRMLCAQRSNMENLARYGARTFYFPMAARVPEEPVAQTISAPDISFVGTPTAFRIRVLNALAQSGIHVEAYGRYWLEHRHAAPERSIEKTLHDIRNYGWARWRAEGARGLLSALGDRFARRPPGERAGDFPRRGFVPDAELPSLFRNSRINLGFTRMRGDDPRKPGLNQVKLRDFEIPAAGGFYLVEEAPDYSDLFLPGVEVETWRTLAELEEKIRYYLEHSAPRERIRAAGERRALRDHSWRSRFASLFSELGIQGHRD